MYFRGIGPVIHNAGLLTAAGQRGEFQLLSRPLLTDCLLAVPHAASTDTTGRGWPSNAWR